MKKKRILNNWICVINIYTASVTYLEKHLQKLVFVDHLSFTIRFKMNICISGVEGYNLITIKLVRSYQKFHFNNASCSTNCSMNESLIPNKQRRHI